MPETLQPLNNQEIAQHLGMQSQQLQTHNPDMQGYVPPHDLALHQASGAWLRNRAEHSTEPLVSVSDQGEHVLATESLEADADELSAWLSDDIRSAREATVNPRAARQAIWDYVTNGGEREFSHYNPNGGDAQLNLGELKEYLGVRGETAHHTDQRETDLHMASLGVAAALVDNWAKRQSENKDEKGRPLDDGDIFLPTDLHEKPAEMPTLHSHLVGERHRFEGRFHELNRTQIERLGETVLDAVGVRQQIAERFGNSTSVSDGEAARRAEVARLRAQHLSLNIRLAKPRQYPLARE
jgi:hypothetical protein